MQKLNKSVLSLRDVSKTYDQFNVIKNATFSLSKGEKVALVGANGSGKTTLLRMSAGLEQPDGGKINRASEINVGYIPQIFDRHKDESAEAYLDAHGQINSANRHAVFAKLNLQQGVLGKRLSELSGGEKTKVALARIMLAENDLLLLDEPTNNLDFQGLRVLESFIMESAKTFLVVSHDREFLDRTVSRVIEIDEFNRTTRAYAGNYSAYEIEKRHLVEKAWQAYTDTKEETERLEGIHEDRLKWMEKIKEKRLGIRYLDPKEKEKPDDAILRDKEGRMGHRAKVMKNRLNRFKQDTSAIEKPRQPLPLKLVFEMLQRSGDKVIELENATFKNGGFELGPINLSVRFGEKILIVGENAAGKSTLIKGMLGQIPVSSGSFALGSRVRIGYLAQEEQFNEDATVRDEFVSRVTMVEEGIGRRSLNRFKIEAADVEKKVSELSSGERSRLTLAILMAEQPNCLVLDEPTNHLDLEVLSSLEGAIKQFEGTAIVVSHDRYFIERYQPSRILRLENGALTEVKLGDVLEK